jgi:Ca2+-binding RTX toxin-like protein
MTFLRRKAAAALVTAGALGAFQALAIVGASSAGAVGVCTFNLATHTVSVSAGAAGDSMTLTVNDPSGAIELDGAACGLADITNTTSISVAGSTGDESVYIDNWTGLAFPSTISWQVAMGTGTADYFEIDLADGADGSVTLGDTSFTMNGATGATGGIEQIDVQGGDGDDTIDGSAVTASGPELHWLSGGDGDDTITGGAGDDFLEGNPACVTADDDTISGGAGDDELYGDCGDDTLSGDAGDDYVEGEIGSDTIVEGTAANGADTLYGDGPGGEDTPTPGDVIDYSGRTTSIIIDPATLSGADANGDGDASDTGDEQDDITQFEVYMTGSANDILTGTSSDETFVPGAGDDEVDGGTGVDTLSFENSAAAVTVDSATGTATGEGADEWTNIDELTGSDNVDVLDFSGETGPVEANLSEAGPFLGLAAGEVNGSSSFAAVTVETWEQAIGTADDDHLVGGNDSDSTLWGGDGDDRLGGLGGRDTLYGEGGNDTMFGDDGNDTLLGGPGSDNMDGGNGVDMVSFADATSGVAVDLSLGVASSADGDDVVTTIEGAIGSAFDDNMLGGTGTNLFKAGKGDDFVRAGSGDDTVRGGAGNDTLVGGGGDDSLYGAKGNDDLFGGGGTDYGNGGKGSDTCKGVEIKKSC